MLLSNAPTCSGEYACVSAGDRSCMVGILTSRIGFPASRIPRRIASENTPLNRLFNLLIVLRPIPRVANSFMICSPLTVRKSRNRISPQSGFRCFPQLHSYGCRTDGLSRAT